MSNFLAVCPLLAVLAALPGFGFFLAAILQSERENYKAAVQLLFNSVTCYSVALVFLGLPIIFGE